ncbi:hypothetical protein O0L34_g17048 [Tuta absoluta]|nr:hypothetical protein O0L34_g17048 [Tuta absoluta]
MSVKSDKIDNHSTITVQITSEAPTHTPTRVTGYHHDVTEYHETKATTTTETKATTTTKIVPITWKPVETTVANDIQDISTKFTTAIGHDDETPEDCHFYKATNETQFDFHKMADIWQTIHYELKNKVPCFKIHIKKITDAERQFYQTKYGTLNGKVNWDHIFLEIKALSDISRRHFLQGSNKGKGVLTNVIISEEINHHALREESSNQWLVVNKLLLMRDCDSGGYIAFSKVPHTPSKSDLTEALNVFGEAYAKGTPACEDDEDERINAAETHYEANDYKE